MCRLSNFSYVIRFDGKAEFSCDFWKSFNCYTTQHTSAWVKCFRHFQCKLACLLKGLCLMRKIMSTDQKGHNEPKSRSLFNGQNRRILCLFASKHHIIKSFRRFARNHCCLWSCKQNELLSDFLSRKYKFSFQWPKWFTTLNKSLPALTKHVFSLFSPFTTFKKNINWRFMQLKWLNLRWVVTTQLPPPLDYHCNVKRVSQT